MGIAVKICGINATAAAEAVLAAKADFAGLVFHPRSPRRVDLPSAAALAGRMRGHTRIVALCVDADDATLAAIVAAVHPDFLQLHGAETPARVAAVRARFGLPVIKAIAVSAAADLAAAAAYDADMFLFDAKAPKSADRPGGLGVAFDWRLLAGARFAKPWLLAGGLTPETVAAAIALSGATGVDVSSGVESAPGVKDTDKIAAFVAAARSPSTKRSLS